MIKKCQSLFPALISSFTFQKENHYKKYIKNLQFPFPEIIPPTFPNYSINIKNFNVIGDGKTLCTEAFSKAIENLYSHGGGKLIIPSGIWLTGPIELKSNINLHLEIGAIIQFSGEEKHYPIIETSFEGLNTKRCQSPLSAKNSINIAITGNGVIDGNGQFWRPIKKEKIINLQWEEIIKRNNGIVINGNYWVPNEGYIKAEKKANMNVVNCNNENELNEYKRFLRPVMVNFVNCKNIFLEGVIFQNSPAWNIHLLICENIIIENIYSKNPSYAQNGDGLDVESCKNILIINCKFEAGDDGICIKSGKDEDGRKRDIKCENVVIDGCSVFNSFAGFVIGSEMSGGVKNIAVKNCQFIGSDMGIRFKSKRGRGGIVENIFIDGISMINIKTNAIIFDMFYRGNKNEEINTTDNSNLVNETTPIFRKINIENIICSCNGNAMEFNGLPEMPIHSIILKNIYIIAGGNPRFNNIKNLKKENVNIIIN